MNNYEKFLQLHHQEKPFIIPNAWNVKSARIIENAGYEAIATSSGAIADSMGYADGEKIPFPELLYIIQRIAACVNIPLSVDLERGYSNDPVQLKEHVQKLIDIGVSGINMEDTQGEDIFLEKLTAIKSYLTKTNQHLFINVRTDSFLQKLDTPLENTLRRAKRYAAAGADGLFVTGVKDIAVVQEITRSVTLPVNVVGVPEFSSVGILADCGVKRISMAVLLYKATYNKMEKMASDIKTGESFLPLFQNN